MGDSLKESVRNPPKTSVVPRTTFVNSLAIPPRFLLELLPGFSRELLPGSETAPEASLRIVSGTDFGIYS